MPHPSARLWAAPMDRAGPVPGHFGTPLPHLSPFSISIISNHGLDASCCPAHLQVLWRSCSHAQCIEMSNLGLKVEADIRTAFSHALEDAHPFSKQAFCLPLLQALPRFCCSFLCIFSIITALPTHFKGSVVFSWSL